MRHVKALALVLAAACLAGGPALGCGSAGKAARYTVPAAPMTLRVLAEGTWSGHRQEVERVLTTEEEWIAFFRGHAPDAAPPAVDFATEMVAAVVLPRNTGGYAVTIERVEETPERLVIHYTEERPGPDMIVIQALTQPHYFAALPKRDKPVSFEREVRVAGGS